MINDSQQHGGASLPESPCSAVLATLAPSRSQNSRRQEHLSQEARDVLAHAFAIGMPASDILPVPMMAAEVLIGPGDLDRIMMGGGFHRHGGSDSMRYFTHADDPEWAIIFAHDCDGDPERGKALIAGYSPNDQADTRRQ